MTALEKPEYDYPSLPYLSRDGIRTQGNHKLKTHNLFLETADAAQKPHALWTLKEAEVYDNDKWYPSAWMVYIHAADEYDACRRLCGNVKQWDAIKAWMLRCGKEFYLESWQAEQAFLQTMKIRRALQVTAMTPGAPGQTSAAKILMAELAPKAKGRPKGEAKPDEGKAKAQDAAVAAASRVVDFQR